MKGIILAGGSGTRVGAGQTKQMLVLDGKPLIVHTLLAFEQCEYIDEIVLVAKEEEMPAYEEFRTEYRLNKLSRIVAGGKTRQASAKNGFDSICEKAAYVAIHDGARAMITPGQIKEVVMTAFAHGAAIAACPATDTVKYAGGACIGETLPREKIWLAQTPQVFMTEMYRAAAYTAKKNGTVATDDASLIEALGFEVYPVDCGKENMKITSPCDFAIAEAILKFRESEEKK